MSSNVNQNVGPSFTTFCYYSVCGQQKNYENGPESISLCLKSYHETYFMKIINESSRYVKEEILIHFHIAPYLLIFFRFFFFFF